MTQSPRQPSATFETVRAYVAEACSLLPTAIAPDSVLVDCGLDSVRVIDLLMALEDAFEITLSEQDPRLANIRTVADLAGLVEAMTSLSSSSKPSGA